MPLSVCVPNSAHSSVRLNTLALQLNVQQWFHTVVRGIKAEISRKVTLRTHIASVGWLD